MLKKVERVTSPKRSNATLPIRSDYFDPDELAALGRQLAETQSASLIGFSSFRFPERLRENEVAILANYEAIADAARKKTMITPAAEWLLDHHHLVKENFRQVARDLPVKFFRQLPDMQISADMRLPRMFALTWAYVAHSDSTFNEDTLTAIVEGFQTTETLKIGEIWAIPAILRYVLLENLRRISDLVDVSRLMRVNANQFADFLASKQDEAGRAAAFRDNVINAVDDSFAAQLLYRLREDTEGAAQALSWLEELLEARDSNAEEAMIVEHAKISTGNLTVGNIIRSLRAIDDFDWTLWFEARCRVDIALRAASDFGLLDARSRNQYRTVIEHLARRSEHSELAIAEMAIDLASAGANGEAPASRQANIGHYLLGSGLDALKRAVGYDNTLSERLADGSKRAGLLIFLLPTLLIAGLILAGAGWALPDALGGWGVALLLAALTFPAWEAAAAIYRAIVFKTVRPSHLPGYEFKAGVPETARALVVIPCLITDRDIVSSLVHQLEVHYLANPDQEIAFALLSDWADSQIEETEADRETLAFANAEIDLLAEKYAAAGPRRFFLLHRRRLYNHAESRWMGWERKRGKLHELNLLLRGDEDTTFIPSSAPLPTSVQYVLTLDADTRLPRDSARLLIGKMAHPLNAPVIDPTSRRVVEGYGILQPRITPSLTTGDEASLFQRIYSRDRGLDPYVFAVSDLYQDLFGEGSFTGKGLYHVDAFHAALAGRIEENTVLSHDLLEGSYARCGLATDVAFVEDFPVRYNVEASRQHRWTRGDWQLLPFIFSATRGPSALSRVKMIDNLRRSLMPGAWIIASLLGWLLLDLGHAAAWQGLLVLSIFVSPVLSLFTGVAPRQPGVSAEGHLRTVGTDFVDTLVQIAMHIAFMAHNAGLMLDAILRTLYRVFISRKHLLEWRTAQQVDQSSTAGLWQHYRVMWFSVALAVVSVAVVELVHPHTLPIAAFFALIWLAAPALAWWTSLTLENEDRLDVSAADVTTLRVIGRRTWRYFETYVTQEHNYLPPDNFQETPVPFVAGRTSPTNIGLYLLSSITARDMGWISLVEAVERLDSTLATVERMEKLNGHLYNWYDTRDLRVLHPNYVSAVDSGNLAGHLVVVASTCREWASALPAHLMGDVTGIADTAQILRETLATIPDDRRSIRPLLRRLEERLEGFSKSLQSVMGEPQFAPVRSIGLSVIAGEVDAFARDLDQEIGTDATRLLVDWASRLRSNCEAHFADAVFDRNGMTAMRARLLSIGERARSIAFGMDFKFLFNRERRLLAIGYRGDDQKLDESCYDLLASEARLTSLFAIAKGDIASEHWFRLGRPVTTQRGRACLVSWSGSMFEYLMPPLVMHERQGGILNQSDNLSIDRQIAYGKSLGVPWGVSESALNARDRELNYQYHNFGVPGLGLKRDLGNNVVIAPYASLLASQFKPREAVVNLKRLEAIGALGVYGYYDAVDFTKARLPEGETSAVVQNYMAHHQGMSITAIGNVVLNGRLRDRFHSDPVIEAAELLLQEKAPREVVPIRTPDASESTLDANDLTTGPQRYRVIDDPLAARRSVSVLSNGHYSVMVTATGSGYSMWNGQAVTRWRADPTMDDWGSYIFLRDTRSGVWWSATPEPKPAPGEISKAVFSDEKAEFSKIFGTLTSKLEVIVATEFDAEGRQLTLQNTGSVDRFIEVTSYGEFVLAPPDNDSAHPAFSKMFVHTEIAESRDAIFATRNKRSSSEPDLAVAHLVTGAGGKSVAEAETDRRAFIGRGRSLSDARAFDPGQKLEGHEGFTLDPIFALRRIVRVPAGKEASVFFWTIAAPNRADLDAQVARYRHAENFAHEANLAWTRAQVQIRHLDMTHSEALLFQRIASILIYPDTRLRQIQTPGNTVTAQQSALWPLSISGDFPIFALRIDDEADLAIIQKSFRMQEYLRSRGIISDLVIINERAASYAQDVQYAIDFMCENASRRGLSSGPAQHIFSVRKDLMEPEAYKTLISAARIVLHTRNGTISEQIERLEKLAEAELAKPQLPHRSMPMPRMNAIPVIPTGGNLLFWNGYGGFDPESRDYVVRLPGGGATPQPWINVISNGGFGFHVSAEGAGFTWSANSRDYQLTPWTNDPVTNRPGEAVFVRDMSSGTVFTPYAGLDRDVSTLHEVRHGPGRSHFKATAGDLTIEMTHIAADKAPAKLMRLRLHNRGNATRNLRVYVYAEWVLGNNRARTAPYIRNWHDAQSGALMASNPFSLDSAGRTAFLAADRPLQSFTVSRNEFLGEGASIISPQAAISGQMLSNSEESNGDPCAAIAIDITVAKGHSEDIVFMLGDCADADDVHPLIAGLKANGFDAELEKTRRQWEAMLGTLQVKTPDRALDLMVNTWLPYQNLACRIRARSAFYQASGAFGFRDQLQDTLALMLHDPGLARTQILNAASRQFGQGDVQHWWLPRTGAGVRTLISDDVVWLGYATASYLAATGDQALLDEVVDFIAGPVLEGETHEAFFQPQASGQTASLYEHCARALDLAVNRTGAHGLPLILGGDWNDGMNRVGIEGRGESTWLGWFMAMVLDMFEPIAISRGDGDRAAAWNAHRKNLAIAIERDGWDGEWYRRGYYDDGAPLGSKESEECRIDSIAQSWSVLSGAGDPARAAQAMDSVMSHLVDREGKLVRLFTPPFEQDAKRDPGYIKSYPPGVRENGGQYTHAAIWVANALATMGRSDDAHMVFSMLNPINHALNKDEADRYRVEPYVVAADIYGADERTGRGGWTWYTGSAGWLYRTAVEAILGIHRIGNSLTIEPSLPADWPGYEAVLIQDSARYEIVVRRKENDGYEVRVNGRLAEGGTFLLAE